MFEGELPNNNTRCNNTSWVQEVWSEFSNFTGTYGMGSSDLVGPDFGSLTGGVHHMQDPLISDSKSGYVKLEDPAPAHTEQLQNGTLRDVYSLKLCKQ
jgi:hypothetical protein